MNFLQLISFAQLSTNQRSPSVINRAGRGPSVVSVYVFFFRFVGETDPYPLGQLIGRTSNHPTSKTSLE